MMAWAVMRRFSVFAMKKSLIRRKTCRQSGCTFFKPFCIMEAGEKGMTA